MAVQCFIDGGLGSFEREMLMPHLQFYHFDILKNGTKMKMKRIEKQNYYNCIRLKVTILKTL